MSLLLDKSSVDNGDRITHEVKYRHLSAPITLLNVTKTDLIKPDYYLWSVCEANFIPNAQAADYIFYHIFIYN